jgi:hypothetical protein
MRASLHYHQLAWRLLAPLPTAAVSTLLPTLKTSLLLIGFTPEMWYPLFPRLLKPLPPGQLQPNPPKSCCCLAYRMSPNADNVTATDLHFPDSIKWRLSDCLSCLTPVLLQPKPPKSLLMLLYHSVNVLTGCSPPRRCVAACRVLPC